MNLIMVKIVIQFLLQGTVTWCRKHRHAAPVISLLEAASFRQDNSIDQDPVLNTQTIQTLGNRRSVRNPLKHCKSRAGHQTSRAASQQEKINKPGNVTNIAVWRIH